jgi:hypothetical protein
MTVAAAAWVLACSGCGGDPEPAPGSSPAPVETARPGATGPRVLLGVGTRVECEAAPRDLQRTIYEGLRRFGLRVDCLAPFRDAAFDAAARAESEAADPEAPVALRITGQADASYADSAFYGQPLAHNFHGQADVLLADGAGAPLRRVSFAHSWGRLRQTRSLEATLADWEDAVHTTVLVGLLTHPAVREAVPEARLAELEAWVESERTRVLGRLERSIPESEVVAALRGFGE